jgi:hypothetical protein
MKGVSAESVCEPPTLSQAPANDGGGEGDDDYDNKNNKNNNHNITMEIYVIFFIVILMSAPVSGNQIQLYSNVRPN